MDLALELDNIRSGYGDVQVLWGISLRVPRGELTTIIGANGAGKTTTLRTIMSSLHPWGGRVWLNGEDVTRLSPHAKANRGLVLVPEGRQFLPICQWKRTSRWADIRGAHASGNGRTCSESMNCFRDYSWH